MKKAILCVDDEQVILTSLKKQLKKRLGNDYVYETAESAEEGLEILDELDEDQIDVLIIVSDWLMPDMKGDEFLIEAHQKFPKITKIFLSGQIEEEAVQRATEQADLKAVLHKPWDEDELVNIIEKAIGIEPVGEAVEE